MRTKFLLFNSQTGETKILEAKEFLKLLDNGFEIVTSVFPSDSINYFVFFCETHKRYECLYYYPSSSEISLGKDLILETMNILKDCKYLYREEEKEIINIENFNVVIYPSSKEKFLTLIKRLKEKGEDAILFAFINFSTAQYLAFDYARKRLKVKIELIKKKVKIGVLEEVRNQENNIITYSSIVLYWSLTHLLKKLHQLKILDTNNYFEEVFLSLKEFLERNENLVDEFFKKADPTFAKIIYDLTDDPRYLKYAL
jgi:hypothetical protein